MGTGQTLLEVEASGETLVRPDTMTISAGVTSEGATALQALRANSEQVQRLLAAVRTLGIELRDTQTRELRVSPLFAPRAAAERNNNDEDERPRRIIGYRAFNDLTLRLRDLNRAPEVIDALFQAGATNLRGPTFYLLDEQAALRTSQGEAVRLARAEADTYAAALGMRVARVLRISERDRSWRNEENSIAVTGSRIRQVIEPGEVPIRVTIWVDFALEPLPR